MSWLRTLLELVLRVILAAAQTRRRSPDDAPPSDDPEPRKAPRSPSRQQAPSGQQAPSRQKKRRRRSRGQSAAESRGDSVADRIRGTVESWRGVPYRMGGTSRSGIDCSAFVRHIYASRFDVDLPRTTRSQSQSGRAVRRDRLRPGDLVFFKISQRTRHVGAYLGGGEFGHASSSKGPIVSRLGSRYWKSRYWTARRVLPDPD